MPDAPSLYPSSQALADAAPLLQQLEMLALCLEAKDKEVGSLTPCLDILWLYRSAVEEGLVSSWDMCRLHATLSCLQGGMNLANRASWAGPDLTLNRNLKDSLV